MIYFLIVICLPRESSVDTSAPESDKESRLANSFSIMTTPELTKWLRDNSSGEHSPAAAAADLIEELLQRFTKLDKPKYSGDAMLDAVLGTPNAEFRVWVDSLPSSYWSRYDLSAARIGWEAACEFIPQNAEVSRGDTPD